MTTKTPNLAMLALVVAACAGVSAAPTKPQTSTANAAIAKATPENLTSAARLASAPIASICGDGVLQPPEECDDGNTAHGDGCTERCTAEAIQLSSSHGGTCAVTAIGTLKCWGKGHMVLRVLPHPVKRVFDGGDVALLSDGVLASVTCSPDIVKRRTRCFPELPIQTSLANPIAATGYYCTALADNSVTCRGWMGFLEATDDSGPFRWDPGVGERPIDLVTTETDLCAVFASGAVRCWRNKADAVPRPKKLAAGETLYGTEDHLCLLKSGKLRCWGYNEVGQLGSTACLTHADAGAVYNFDMNCPPIDFGKGRKVVQFQIGKVHNCALLDDGGLRCWGSDRFGQLGYGRAQEASCFDGDHNPPCNMTPPAHAIDVHSTSPIKSFSLNDSSTCVLFEDATVKCWGQNDQGQLGYGDTKERPTPTDEVVPY